MALNQDGYIGEQKAFDFFKEKRMKCFQSDLIVRNKDGSYFVVEVKYQDIFEPPPFYGHGLPDYQVQARMEFYEKTKIPCLFLVFDKNDIDIYYNWLHVLNDGHKIYTLNRGRVVFDIDNFKKVEAKKMLGA